MRAVSKWALTIIRKSAAALPFKSKLQTGVHLHPASCRCRDSFQEIQTKRLRRQADVQRECKGEIMSGRPLTSPSFLRCPVPSPYCARFACLLMSAVKEAVPEHSSGGRVTWAGERYRWFDCHPPGGGGPTMANAQILCAKNTQMLTHWISSLFICLSAKSHC